ncbi:MAG TPA: alpha/beta hydrolase-fold protein [Oscillatoriaceae cyanobacterium]
MRFAFAATMLALLTGCGLAPRPMAIAAPTAGLAAKDVTGDVQVIHDVASHYLSLKRDLWVYLPPGYGDPANAQKRYPVLYMHDGQNLFDPTAAFGGNEWHVDETAQQLITSGAVPPLIIVGVANTAARMDEYTWVPGTVDGQTMGGKGQAYANFLTKELKPLIDRTYRTKPDRDDTGICGSSLGGLIDIYLARYDSAVYGKIGIMSPSVWWDNKAVLGVVPQMPTNARIWLDIGHDEGDTPQEMLGDARELEQDLITRGYTAGQNLDYFEDPIGGHNEQAWAYRFPMVLKYLFGKN